MRHRGGFSHSVDCSVSGLRHSPQYCTGYVKHEIQRRGEGDNQNSCCYRSRPLEGGLRASSLGLLYDWGGYSSRPPPPLLPEGAPRLCRSALRTMGQNRE